MKLLLDHNLPHPLRRRLPGPDVHTTEYHGWDELQNGYLLRAAADGGFDALLTVDKAMEHQQNLLRLPVAIIRLDAPSTRLSDLLPFVPAVLGLVGNSLTPAPYVVGRDGSVLRLTVPRRR